MPSDNRYSISGVLAGVLIGLITIVCFISFSALLGAGNENVEPYFIGRGLSVDSRFEVFTFRHNQHRCFVVTTKENLIDLECP